MSASKAKGTKFESLIVAYLIEHLQDDRIERRTLSGTRDRGDVAGLRHMGQRLVLEAKNTTRWQAGTWLNEAEIERGNDDAGVGMVCAKRVGKGKAGDQIVMLTLRDLVSLMTGTRPDDA